MLGYQYAPPCLDLKHKCQIYISLAGFPPVLVLFVVLLLLFLVIFKYLVGHFNILSVEAGEIDGSGVKSTDCSFRGLEFDSQHPEAGTQASVIPAPGDLAPSSGLHG